MRATAALIVVPMVLGSVVSAHAASAFNSDTVTHTLTVREAGRSYSVTLRPGQSATLCEQGCFVRFPNGDLLGLSGFELIEIGTDGLPRFL